MQTFTLANSSGSPTTLEVSITGSLNFAITSDGCSGIKLANGRACYVIVRYTAATAGGDIGTLKARSTGKKPQTLSTSISLNGSGRGTAHLYWSSYQDSLIRKANLDGSNVQTVYSTYASCSVAVDESYVYLGECNGNPLIRANMDGSNAFYFPGIGAESLRFSGGRIYWAANSDDIAVADPDGSNYQGNLIGGGIGVNSMTVGGQ